METEKTFEQRLNENQKKLLGLLDMDLKSAEYKKISKEANKEHRELMKEAKQRNGGHRLPTIDELLNKQIRKQNL